MVCWRDAFFLLYSSLNIYSKINVVHCVVAVATASVAVEQVARACVWQTIGTHTHFCTKPCCAQVSAICQVKKLPAQLVPPQRVNDDAYKLHVIII